MPSKMHKIVKLFTKRHIFRQIQERIIHKSNGLLVERSPCAMVFFLFSFLSVLCPAIADLVIHLVLRLSERHWFFN